MSGVQTKGLAVLSPLQAKALGEFQQGNSTSQVAELNNISVERAKQLRRALIEKGYKIEHIVVLVTLDSIDEEIENVQDDLDKLKDCYETLSFGKELDSIQQAFLKEYFSR